MTPKRLAEAAFVPVVRRRAASSAGRHLPHVAYLLSTPSSLFFSRAIFSIVRRAPPSIRHLTLRHRT
jgi:hypothetical protein